MMTLEEAITHCKEKDCDNTQCALEHRQLAEWLKELQQYRNKGKLKDLTFADAIKYGYEQAQQDLMGKAKRWFTEYTNIPYEVETNEDGEPLSDSYIQYAKAKLDAANEMFEKFKQFITEN